MEENKIVEKKEGRVFEIKSTYLNEKGTYYMCNECCNGDRCDDPTHYSRLHCPHCLGTGSNLTSDKLNSLTQNNKDGKDNITE